jgi:hypothetical protein
MKNITNKFKGAKEMFGIEITVDPTLDKMSGKTLFPEKLAKANEILSKLEFKLG